MGAFIGYDHVGVWASNRERDAFLDWFAAHRCQPHDAIWEFCKSEGNRWTGCCIHLEHLIPRGKLLAISEAEMNAAAAEFWPNLARLIGIIGEITRGEWHHLVSSKESINWRQD